jgi:O-antigen chain-terminating methyltransferase
MEEQQIRAIAGYLDGIEASQYSDFENIFRGTREDIKNRQAVYLPYFERVPSGTTFPILDIGCGRGEFLEVLSESGRDATGVDANPTMVERCRELGLQVEHADAIDYLRRAKSGHYAVITTFHLVEHLPHPRVLALLDEALRALRPGGLLILETPNPQNLIVGSSTFYLDPTHLNPIPPAQLRFIVEARGFVNAEVKPMHPVPEYARPSGVEIPSYLAELLYGPQDYAVLAWKA